MHDFNYYYVCDLISRRYTTKRKLKHWTNLINSLHDNAMNDVTRRVLCDSDDPIAVSGGAGCGERYTTGRKGSTSESVLTPGRYGLFVA